MCGNSQISINVERESNGRTLSNDQSGGPYCTMNILDFTYVAVLLFFGLMVLRAFRSGSAVDYLLGGAQVVGLLVMLGDYRQIGAYLLLITALAYLASQVVTPARPISRLLPIAGALVIMLYLLADREG